MRKFQLIDFCQPDYFTGYRLPVLQIPVYASMNNEEIVKDLKEEFESSFELFENIKDFEQLLNNFCEELLKNPSEIFVDYKETESTESSDEFVDFSEPEYLFFSITDVKIINGMTFLN